MSQGQEDSDSDFAVLGIAAPAAAAPVVQQPPAPKAAAIVAKPQAERNYKQLYACSRMRETLGKKVADRQLQNSAELANAALALGSNSTAKQLQLDKRLKGISAKGKRNIHRLTSEMIRKASQRIGISAKGKLNRHQDVAVAFDKCRRDCDVARRHGANEKSVMEARVRVASTGLSMVRDHVRDLVKYCKGQNPLATFYGRKFDSAKSRLRLPMEIPMLGSMAGEINK
jgi:hypothetical protein